MMKIAIFSDPHLGRRNFRKASNILNDIERLGYQQFNKYIDNVISNNPDLLVITGDLFHNSSPTSYSINECIKGLKKLDKNKIQTRILAGNHDFNNKNHKLGNHLFELLESALNSSEYVKFIYKSAENEVFNNNNKNKSVNIVYLPHINIESNENGDLYKSEYYNQLNLVKNMSNTENLDDISILFSHGVIDSWIDRFISVKDNDEKVKYKNQLLLNTLIIDDNVSNMFDLTILGHIHNSFNQVIDGNKGLSYRISPGSTMEDNESSFMTDKNEIPSTGVLYIDTDSISRSENSYSNFTEFHNISSVKKIVKEFYSIDDLINLLENIDFNIYLLKYYGEWKDIPSELFKEALSKSLYLNLKIENPNKIELNKTYSKVESFWDWCDQNISKELKLEFQNIVKEV